MSSLYPFYFVLVCWLLFRLRVDADFFLDELISRWYYRFFSFVFDILMGLEKVFIFLLGYTCLIL